jgi:hypothetical protein
MIFVVEDFERIRITGPNSLHEPACVFHGTILR